MTKEKFGDSGSREYEMECRKAIIINNLHEKPFLSFPPEGLAAADNPLKTHKTAKRILGISTKLFNQKCGSVGNHTVSTTP